MEIPKKILKLLERRERLALELMEVISKVDSWLETVMEALGQLRQVEKC